MKRIFKTIVSWYKKAIIALTPGKNTFSGAAKFLLVALGIIFLSSSIISAINVKDPWLVVFYLGFTGLFVLLAFGINWALGWLVKIPRLYRLALIVSFAVLSIMFRESLTYMIIAISSVLGASVFALFKTKFKNLTTFHKIMSLLGLGASLTLIVMGVVKYSSIGIEVEPLINVAFTSETKVEHIPLESPAKEGNYKVKTLFYGSGKDRHRDFFGKDVDIKTDSVNGVAFLDNWEGISGWWRTKYWGFDFRSLPLNAQVWYPEGEGPFPLVLVVHGNHPMQDFSDPGYEYLGELLASRGMIVASVDENFLNGSWSDEFSDGLSKENDARAWVLLEHFRQWHEWNDDKDSPFFNKVDTDNLALIGHSRGGEAVGHAALLNQLPFYSDDASIQLDYNFNIKSVVAIAPVDGQYSPGGTRTKLKDVNYFVIHGAQDADVSSYAGNRQFDRIKFTDSIYQFKSGLYVYGANHGQFNTSWGNNDVGTPFTRLLNLKQLLSGEDQREIAKVYISAFFEATLKDDKRYLPLFADVRAGKNWLPETIYLNQFEDSNSEFIATFEEDFDVTTFTTDSIQASSKGLTVWKEKRIPMKWGSKESRGLFLGWHYKQDDKDAFKKDTLNVKEEALAQVHDSLIASYSIKIDKNLSDIDSTSVFVFSMAESKLGSNPKSGGKWVKKDNDNDKNKDNDKESDNKEEENEENEENEDVEENTNSEDEESDKEEEKKDDDKDEKKAKDPIDFSISVKDRAGNTVYFPLSNFSKLQRRLGVKLWKYDDSESEKSENVLQLFSFPLKNMVELNPELDLKNISEIKFIFDRSDKGVVVIDNVGFMKDLSAVE